MPRRAGSCQRPAFLSRPAPPKIPGQARFSRGNRAWRGRYPGGCCGIGPTAIWPLAAPHAGRSWLRRPDARWTTVSSRAPVPASRPPLTCRDTSLCPAIAIAETARFATSQTLAPQSRAPLFGGYRSTFMPLTVIFNRSARCDLSARLRRRGRGEGSGRGPRRGGEARVDHCMYVRGALVLESS